MSHAEPERATDRSFGQLAVDHVHKSRQCPEDHDHVAAHCNARASAITPFLSQNLQHRKRSLHVKCSDPTGSPRQTAINTPTGHECPKGPLARRLPQDQLVARHSTCPCKVRPGIRVHSSVQGNSIRWGLDELSSTRAPHRPLRPTLVPRVIPTRANVANAVVPAPRRFMEAHHVQRQRRSGVCEDRSK